MKKDMTIEQILQQLDEKMAWFHSEDFRLEEAKERFVELKRLADQAETMLNEMKNEIEVISQDFSEK